MARAFKEVKNAPSGEAGTRMFACPLSLDAWSKIEAIRAAGLAGKVTGKAARLTNDGIALLAVDMLYNKYCKKPSTRKATTKKASPKK
jgi:hypothetical protein